MTAVVELERRVLIAGDLKIIVIQTNADAASTHTIDFNTDAAHGKDAILSEIFITVLQDDAGADKVSTWDPATGIVTLSTITTGIHNLLVIGK